MLQFKRSRAAAPGTECPDRVAEKPLRRAGLHDSAEHSGRYCQTAPCSSYSAFWHTVAVGGKTYGFACDDYTGQSCGFNSPDARYVQVQSAGNPVHRADDALREPVFPRGCSSGREVKTSAPVSSLHRARRESGGTAPWITY